MPATAFTSDGAAMVMRLTPNASKMLLLTESSPTKKVSPSPVMHGIWSAL